LPLDFPNTPTVGDSFADRQWDGTAWVNAASGVVIAPTPPTNPTIGALWWRNDPDGDLYLRYDDGSSIQWVPAAKPQGAAGLHIGVDPPPDPVQGMQWWDSDSGDLAVYYDDGTSAQWVQTNTSDTTTTFYDAPTDGYGYARRGHTWSRILPEDVGRPAAGGLALGVMYGMQDNEWTVIPPAGVFISDSPPPNPVVGQQWWDSDSGNSFVWFQDVDSSQWVQTNTAGGGDLGGAILGDVKSGFQTADHNGWVKLDGRAVSTLTASQQTNAASLGFTANLPNAGGAVPMQDGSAMGTVTGSMAKTITRANLPAFDMSAASAGGHAHSFPGRYGAPDKDFVGWANTAGTRWGSTMVLGRSSAAGGGTFDLGETMNTGGAHTHVVASGGSGTALDVTPKRMSINYYVFLGA
jgi:hypothetical protein